MANNESYALRVTWDEGIALPELIGPFSSPKEAQNWAPLNVPNGKPEVVQLARPYHDV